MTQRQTTKKKTCTANGFISWQWSSTRLRIAIGCSVLLVICLLKGCGSAPQMTAPNRKLLEALQTAVSAKKMEWLELVETQVTEKRASQEMSDAEFNAITSIISKAKSGHWKEAQKDSFVLSEGQRPSAADLALLKGRKPVKSNVPN